MVHSLIKITLLEQLSKRAVLSLVVDYILGFRDSDSIKRGNSRGFVSFTHAALVSRDQDTHQDADDRDYDQELDQRKAFAA